MIDGRASKDLKDELVGAIDTMKSGRGGDDDEEEEEDERPKKRVATRDDDEEEEEERPKKKSSFGTGAGLEVIAREPSIDDATLRAILDEVHATPDLARRARGLFALEHGGRPGPAIDLGPGAPAPAPARPTAMAGK